MKRKMLSLMILALSAISLQAEAQSLRLGQPAYGGTGCPSGSASVTLSPDNSAVSILFDSYITEAGHATGRTVDRKSCNISVPVQVPNGYSVAVFQVDYRGYNLVPRGGMARFDAEYFWAGSQGPRISRTFMGPTNDNFSLTDNLLAQTMVWTPCGASVNLRVNTSMMSKSNARGEQAMSMVDSADISSGLIYHIQYRRCR
ncbi:DUF4360 domain-containing protein [Bdellovibrio sp. HCB2-146]|uniref:DUF4360 domain-containing protein n=1 Tax=Bdellovibrio sp. HCB2-146 TaxID=3394362 RepID=UPI0039BD6BB9